MQRLQSLKNQTKKFSEKITLRWVLLFAAFFGFVYLLSSLLIIYYLVGSPLHNQSLSLSINSTSCASGSFFFPDIYKYSNEDFTPSFSNTVNIADLVIFSDTICLTPTRLLEEQSSILFSMYPFGLKQIPVDLTVSTDPYAEVIETEEVFANGVNVNAPIYFNIDSENTIFEYTLRIGEKGVLCERDLLSIHCDIKKLELEQDKYYQLELTSSYAQDEVQRILGTSIKTNTPTNVVSTSLEKGVKLLDLNSEIIVEFDKDLSTHEQVRIEKKTDSKFEEVDTSVVIAGKQLKVSTVEQMDKASEYRLHVENVIANDGSFLNTPYDEEFVTADGPVVISTNLTASKFSSSGNLVLNFDQELFDTQNIRQYVSLTPSREYTFAVLGKQLVINPVSNFDQCEVNTISVKPGLLNSNSISSSRGFTQSLKTSCAREGVAGYSVQGRPIYVYYFGNGPNRIIYYGAMHGSESNSATLLNYWVGELEAKYDQIPKDKTIIVVPVLNPDGYAAGKRFNANEVDVNRNFGGSDWQSETFWSIYTYPNGGGTAPFSEPESVAIRNLIYANSPYLVLSYHSAASYVVPNSLGTSISYAQRYSQLSGYSYVPPTTVDAFDYGITGSFGIWAQEIGYPSITVELASQYSSETARNFPAMWNMLQ